MGNIYVVTKGEYSDYSVYGVFSDELLAKKYAELLSDPDWDTAQVETYELNKMPDFPANKLPFTVEMDIDGNTPFGVKRSSLDDFEKHYFFSVGCLVIDVWATDEQHAIKIANEKRVQLIAENKWGKAEEAE